MVFVVIFTQIAVNERKARAEVERLAAELRQYAAQVEELAITKERNRLAREIHDSLGHYLTIINVQIEAARAIMDNDRQRALDGLSKAQMLAQKALAEVRRSVTALRASPIEDLPLSEAVAKLVDEYSAAGIAAELVVTGAPRPLTPQAGLTLYRAAQEGLTNVRKHSQATHATLRLDYSHARMVRLEVRDNGVGRSGEGEGFGLLGVRERARLLNGEVRIHTAAGQGFTLEVELPG
jgi:signal transduction histidine kinase